MNNWRTTEIENDTYIVHCPEGDYRVVGSLLAHFQELLENERRAEETKAKDRVPPGTHPTIDGFCGVRSSELLK
jgi:hypothetical protein